MKRITITSKNLMIKDIKADINRIYSTGTRRKNLALLSNKKSAGIIKVERISDGLYLLGGFPYYYAAVQKDPNMTVKCIIHEYHNAQPVERLLRVLNSTYVEKSRDWYLYNGLIKQINSLGMDDHEIANKLNLNILEVARYKLDSKMDLYYQEYAVKFMKETLFNAIINSPLTSGQKNFLFSLAISKNVKLTKTNVQTLEEYIRAGYYFNEEHVDAVRIFNKITKYKTYVKEQYWRNISESYFPYTDFIFEDASGDDDNIDLN